MEEAVSALFFKGSRSKGDFSCVAVIYFHLLVIAVLLSTGKASAQESPRISAFVGETVILPCSIDPPNDLPTVEWSKDGSDIVFLYRDGCETFEMKIKDFQYRTSLIMKELQNGNMALRISNLRLSDGGTYRCKILWRDKEEVVSTVELFVGNVSEPKLEFVPDEGVGVTLQCKADCWFPEPLITFLNQQGDEIDAKNPQRSQDLRDCSTVTRTVTLETATNRVFCRVHQPQTNQTRVTDIYIPDAFMRSCTNSIATAIGVTLIIVCAMLTAAFFVHKYVSKVRGQKPPDEVVTSGNQAYDVGLAVVEDIHPPAGVNDPLSTQSPAVQHQSTNDSGSSADTSKPVSHSPHDVNPSIASSTRNHPKSDDLSKTRCQKLAGQRPKRTPGLWTDAAAALSSSPSASTSEGGGVFRSKSVSESCHPPSRDNAKRRHTMTVMPVRPNNIFNLPDLKEESESLIQ